MPDTVEPPRWNSVEGMYQYLMGLIMLLAALLALYVVGVYLGLVPPPEQIVKTERPGVLLPPAVT